MDRDVKIIKTGDFYECPAGANLSEFMKVGSIYSDSTSRKNYILKEIKDGKIKWIEM